MRVRPATFADLDAYATLQAERWTDENQATREDLECRFRVHPAGMLVAEDGGRVVGMVFAMRLTVYNYDNPPSWYEVTANGRCDNHDPSGPYIFGVDLSTAVGVGAKAGDKLLEAIGQLAIRENIKTCLLGGRMPGYHKYQLKMTADEYLHARNSVGQPLDAQVRFYTSQSGIRVVKALPNYFKDPESCDYGVLLRWRNPLYGFPARPVWAAAFPILLRLETWYLKLSKTRR